jgi:uncharacterized DUF497 family protein
MVSTLKQRNSFSTIHAASLYSIEKIIVLVVVHTYREQNSEDVIRIISARRATRKEKKLYAQSIG